MYQVFYLRDGIFHQAAAQGGNWCKLPAASNTEGRKICLTKFEKEGSNRAQRQKKDDGDGGDRLLSGPALAKLLIMLEVYSSTNTSHPLYLKIRIC